MTTLSAKMKIMIVGAEATSGDLKRRLEKLGYTVNGQAASGDEALDRIARQCPDLIVMDTVLQGDMDGVGVAEIVWEKWRVPVVFMTAAPEIDLLERAGLTYPFRYLVKPFQDRDLKTAIEIALYVSKAEADKRRAEEELNRIFCLNPNMICVAHVDGYFKRINPAFGRILGYSRQELLAKPIMEFVHPEDREATKQAMMSLTYGEPTKIYINRYVCKDGSVKWLEWMATMADEDGRLFAAARDITDHKRAEEALRESQERFRFLIKNSSDILVIINEEGNQRYVSSAAERITGYSADELVEKSLADIIHPDDIEEIYRAWDEAAAHPERIMRVQYRHIHKTRGWVHLEALAQNFFDEPSVRGLVASVRDVTDRKKAEAEKEKLQTQLLQAQKMEAIGTLAGGIAHDFNNLLQAINGYTQLLLMKKEEDAPDFHKLKAIQDAGFRASELVRQLLLFSRKADTERRPVELDREIEQARMMLERTIPKMVDIRIKTGEGLWKIMADPIQIEQMLLNLGTNAADAMPDGGVLLIETENMDLDEVYAQTHLGAKPGRYVLMTVADTGLGMDRETMDKIFEPFFTTKEFGKGTGLGLASVYGIIRNHGGYIKCYSETGQGTTFKIYLPAMDQADIVDEKSFSAEPVQGGLETVLVVDDEEAIRGFARQALEEFGYTVLTASSGEEALEIYSNQAEDIALVVLDLGMPGMGGHRCLMELRQVNPEIQIIIASGYSIQGQVKKSLEAGALGYVGKPYRVIDLLTSVRRVLDGEELGPFQK